MLPPLALMLYLIAPVLSSISFSRLKDFPTLNSMALITWVDPPSSMMISTAGCSFFNKDYQETVFTTERYEIPEIGQFRYIPSTNSFILFDGLENTLFRHYDSNCNLLFTSHTDLAYNNSVRITGMTLLKDPDVFLIVWPEDTWTMTFTYYNTRTLKMKSNRLRLEKETSSAMGTVCFERRMNELICGISYETYYEINVYDISNYDNQYGNYQYDVITHTTLDVSSLEGGTAMIERGKILRFSDTILFFCLTLRSDNRPTYCSRIIDDELTMTDIKLHLDMCKNDYTIFNIKPEEGFLICLSEGRYYFKKLFEDLDFNDGYANNIPRNALMPKRAVLGEAKYFSNSDIRLVVSSNNYVGVMENNIPECENSNVVISQNGEIEFSVSIPNRVIVDTYYIDFVEGPDVGALKIKGTDSDSDIDVEYLTLYKDFESYTFVYQPNGCELKEKSIKYTIYNRHMLSSQICSMTLSTCYSSCGSCDEVGNDIEHKCTSCAENFYPLIDKQTNCVNEKTKPENYYYNNGQYEHCYETCGECDDIGDDSDNKCTTCKSGYMLNPLNDKICIKECDNKWYIDKENNEYTCTDECGEIYKNYRDDTKECIYDCKLNNTFYYEYKCIDTCPSDTKEYNNECVDSCSLNTFEYANSCYDKCPDGLLKEDTKCVTKCSTGKVLYKGECIDTCPSDTLIYNDQCLTSCPDDHQYEYIGQCVSSCPDDTFEYEHKCLLDCESFLYKDTLNHKCINCKSNSQYLYNNECISSLPTDTFISNDTYNIISSCFYQIDSSTIGTYYNIESQCIHQCPSGNFFYNTTISACSQCYSTCLTCESIGDATSHNCTTCNEGLTHYLPYFPSNCLPICEHYWKYTTSIECLSQCDLYTIEDTNECVEHCDTSTYVTYNKKCLTECPSGYKEENNTCIDSRKNMLDKESNATKIIDSIKGDLANIIDDIDSITAEIVKKENVTIQLYPTDEIDKANEQSKNNNISRIDFSQCEEEIRRQLDMNIDDKIYILKYDIESSDGTIATKIKAFDDKGKEINIGTICSNVSIDISTPIEISNETLSYLNNGIDIYNASDPFFNDICVPYTSSDNKDITLTDRQNDIYIQQNYCYNGCEYSCIDTVTKTAKCKCSSSSLDLNTSSVSSPIDLDDETLILSSFNSLKSSSIKVIKCYTVIITFEYLKHNIGFWLFLSLTIFEFIIGICSTICGYERLYAYLHKFAGNSKEDAGAAPPHLNILDEIEAYPNGKRDSTDALYKTPKNKKYYSANNNYTSSNISSFETHYGSNQLTSSKINLKNSKTYRDGCSNVNRFTETAVDDDNNNNIIKYKIASKKTDEEIIQTTTKIKNSEEQNESPQTEIENYDELDFEDAMLNDKRNFFAIYWSFLSNKQMLLSICFNKNPFAPSLIRLYLAVITISLFFVFNALLFKDDFISNRYHNSKGNFDFVYIITNEFSKCVIASFITSFMNFIISFIFSHYAMSRVIKEEGNKGKKFLIDIRKEIRCLRIKYAVSILVLFIIFVLMWYYVTVFCAVFHNTQSAWLEGSLITLIFNNLLSLVLLMISALLRFASVKCKSLVCFKVSNIFSEFS